MKVWIVRHALAMDREEYRRQFHQVDSLRPLVPQGRKRSKRVFKYLKNQLSEVEWVLSSPYLRAKDTAKIFSKKMTKKNSLVLLNVLTPEADVEELIILLFFLESFCRSLMIVGHEPHLSRFLSFLFPQQKRWKNSELKKSSVCALRWQKDTVKFIKYWTPKNIKT